MFSINVSFPPWASLLLTCNKSATTSTVSPMSTGWLTNSSLYILYYHHSSYLQLYWHLRHYTVRKPIKTALSKLLFSNDRAVCIIVWHTVALVRTHALNGRPIFLLDYFAQRLPLWLRYHDFCHVHSGIECKDEVFAAHQVQHADLKPVLATSAPLPTPAPNCAPLDLPNGAIVAAIPPEDERPIPVTELIFAPRKKEMNKGFLMFSQDEGLTSELLLSGRNTLALITLIILHLPIMYLNIFSA